MSWVKVCDHEKKIPENGFFRFQEGGEDILLAKTATGQVFAFENKCSHADKPLHVGKWNSAKGEVTCPFHKATFSLLEGGKALTPPAVLPIMLYAVRIDSESQTVSVEIPD